MRQIKIRELYIGVYVLLAALVIRIYGYYFDSSSFLTEITIFSVCVFVLFSIIKMVHLKNCAYNPLLNISALFWIWSCISTMINIDNLSEFINNIVLQSFWFLFLIFFTYYSSDLYFKDMRHIKNICSAALIVFGLAYIFWCIFEDKKIIAGAINSVYYCLLLLPIVFIQKNKILIIFSLIITLLAVLMSGKRTAFIALVLALFIPFLFIGRNRKLKLKNIAFFVFLLFSTVAAYNIIRNTFEITIFNRFQTLIEDEGSGRLEIYKEVISGFNDSTIWGKLFGHGFNGVSTDRLALIGTGNLTATSAHNDFLEVLYDYGVFGFLLYIAMTVRLVTIALQLKKINIDYFRMYLSALIIFIIMSMFSHLIIYPTYIVFLLIYFSWGSSIVLKEKSTIKT